MNKRYFYGKEVTKDHPAYNKSREGTTSGLHQRFENIVSFWTKKEYELQELIIQGFVVHREIPGQSLRTKPFARIDIWYDGPNGIGRKAINGVEEQVLKEAQKFLSVGELDLLNDNWIKARFEGKYKWNDPFCRQPIYDKTLPAWIIGKRLNYNSKKEKEKLKKHKKYVEQKLNEQIKDSASSLNKRINDFLKEIHYKEKINAKKELENEIQSPLQDLIRTKNIDPKDVVGEDNLSTLYKHIKGDRELSKTKAIDYAKTLGVAPGTLMFEPKAINVWSNVKLSDKIEAPDGSVAILPGECYERIRTEVTVCPSELYRLDVRAIRVNDPDSIYDGFMAYYYETDKVSEAATNKLCMVRTKVKGKTLLGGHYRYYLGIFQIFGTKKMIVNVDPLSENRIIAADIEPDVVAPIVSFTKPYALLADKVLSKNIKQVQQLGELIRKEKEKAKEYFSFNEAVKNDPNFYKKLEETNKKYIEATKEITKKIEELEQRISLEQRERVKQRMFGIPGLLSNDDDYEVPNFLRKEEKKRA
jgi:hypothetical protein